MSRDEVNFSITAGENEKKIDMSDNQNGRAAASEVTSKTTAVDKKLTIDTLPSHFTTKIEGLPNQCFIWIWVPKIS